MNKSTITAERIESVLRKLCVRPGMQRTTHVFLEYPLVVLDMCWRDGDFMLVLSWPLRTKEVVIPDTEIVTKTKGNWARDKTYRLTEQGVLRLAPGLADALMQCAQCALWSSS